MLLSFVMLIISSSKYVSLGDSITPKYLDQVFFSLDRLSEKFNPDTDNARVHTLSLTHKQWLFRSPFFDIQVCYFGKSTQVALVSGTIDFTSPPFSKLRY